MLRLNDRKVNHLRELIETFYDLENEVEKADCASTIVGVLDYILDTDTYSEEAELDMDVEELLR